MNGRYFGDTRDLFKFDLVLHIMKSLPELAGFTFVPMLTGTEAEGSRKNTAKKDLEKAYRSGKAGSQNRDLREHLTRLQEINDDGGYITGICAYFDKEMILIDIPGRQKFTNQDRDAYFRSVVDNFPKNSLVFLDPDTGLKDERPNSKHLLLSEVKTVYDRMDSGSILMIYQHFPRVKHGEYVRRTCMQLENGPVRARPSSPTTRSSFSCSQRTRNSRRASTISLNVMQPPTRRCSACSAGK